MTRKPVEVKREENLTSDYYGMLVFDRPKMKKYLSKIRTRVFVMPSTMEQQSTEKSLIR